MANSALTITERIALGWRLLLRRLQIVEQPREIEFGQSYGADYGVQQPYPVVASMAAFGKFPWVYAAVEAVANDIAGLPLQVRRIVGQRSRAVDRHPFTTLLQRPSSQVGPTLWRRQMIVDLLLTGNFYGLVLGRGAAVTSIVRLHPESVQIIPSTSGGVLAYRFTQDGSHVDYSPDDVVHIRQTSYREGPAGLYGQGVIEVLETDLSGEFAAAKRLRDEAHRGQPRITISPKDGASIRPDVLQKMVQNIQQHAEKTGIIPIGGPVDINQLPFNARDMEFSNGRDWTRSSILAVVGVAYVRLFLPSANFATAQQQNRIYWQNLLGLMALVDDGLSRIAARMGRVSDRVKHDTSGVEALQESRTDRLNRAAQLVEVFGLDPVKALNIEGFSEIDETMLPASQPAGEPAEVAPAAEPAIDPEDGLLVAQRQDLLVGAGLLTVNEARAELGYEPTAEGDTFRPRLVVERGLSDLSETVQEGLKNKADEHNEAMKDRERWRRTTPGVLAQVFERGVGAFNTNPGSVRPGVGSADEWAYARVNSFLYALRNDKYRSGKHDTDLLPEEHPQSTRGEDKSADAVSRYVPQRYVDIDFSPTAGMIEEAKKAVKWIEEGEAGSGMVQSTKVWARKVANGEMLTPEKVRAMNAWYPRHESDLDGEGANPGEDGYPSPGRVAWAAWFGDAGRSFAARRVRQMDAADEADRQRAIAAKGADMRHNIGVTLKRVTKYHDGKPHEDEEKLIQDTFRFVASTAQVDRMGDIVEQSWQLDAYRKNPVILWNHDSTRAPIARATDVAVVNGQLEIEMQFDMADPFAAEVAGKIQRGFINAGSVGFFPGVVKYRGDLEPEDPRYSRDGFGIVASNNELVEFSITPVPANSSALLAASVDAATDDELRRLLGNKHNRQRLATLLYGNDAASTHDHDCNHSQDVKHADPLGWLRDTTTEQAAGLPFLKE